MSLAKVFCYGKSYIPVIFTLDALTVVCCSLLVSSCVCVEKWRGSAAAALWLWLFPALLGCVTGNFIWQNFGSTHTHKRAAWRGKKKTHVETGPFLKTYLDRRSISSITLLIKKMDMDTLTLDTKRIMKLCSRGGPGGGGRAPPFSPIPPLTNMVFNIFQGGGKSWRGVVNHAGIYARAKQIAFRNADRVGWCVSTPVIQEQERQCA